MKTNIVVLAKAHPLVEMFGKTVVIFAVPFLVGFVVAAIFSRMLSEKGKSQSKVTIRFLLFLQGPSIIIMIVLQMMDLPYDKAPEYFYFLFPGGGGFILSVLLMRLCGMSKEEFIKHDNLILLSVVVSYHCLLVCVLYSMMGLITSY